MTERKIISIEPGQGQYPLDREVGQDDLGNMFDKMMAGFLQFGGKEEVEIGASETAESVELGGTTHQWTDEIFDDKGNVIRRTEHTVIYGPEAGIVREEVREPSRLTRTAPTTVIETRSEQPVGWGTTYVYKETSFLKRLFGHGGLDLPVLSRSARIGSENIARRGLFGGERVTEIVNATGADRMTLQEAKGIEIISPSEFSIRHAGLGHR